MTKKNKTLNKTQASGTTKTLFEKFEALLKKDERLIASDGSLLKNKIQELIRKNDPALIQKILSDATIRKPFCFLVDGTLVFDKEVFIRFVSNKQFLEDSYTAFENKIGLSVNGDYLKKTDEVVLVWPFKDCVLEGDMTKENQKREEIFYNETLAPDDIDRLLDPKAFTNFKRIDRKGEHKLDSFRRDSKGNIADNLIIKGNNLLVLASLKKQFPGNVKLIYIDPPYNRDADAFYNDNFKHSTWLTFMKNRLEVAKTFLAEDGAIMVQCDDTEQAYLRVLMDDVFGNGSFLNTLSLKTKVSAGASGGGEDKKIKKNIEYVHIYVNKAFPGFKPVFFEQELMRYIEEMKSDEKSFKYTQVLISTGKKKFFKEIKDGSGETIKIYKHSDVQFKSVNQVAKDEKIKLEDVYNKYFDQVFTTTNAQSSIRQRVWDVTGNSNEFFSIEYIPKSGKSKGKLTTLYYTGNKKVLVIWLKDTAARRKRKIYKLIKYGTFWDGFNYNNLNKEGDTYFPSGKKPEELLERVIYMATEKGQIVMDYHLGSGTTCAVAHKMGRQYVGIEQLDYGENDSVVRLKNVIKGDQSGISEIAGWKDGGNFVYMELSKWNENWSEKIKEAKTAKDLLRLWGEMKGKAFLSYKVDPKTVDENAKEFSDLELKDQKRFLMACLDKNQLYVNYSEIDDKDYAISASDKKLNKDFYKD